LVVSWVKIEKNEEWVFCIFHLVKGIMRLRGGGVSCVRRKMEGKNSVTEL
jgi:hypothetical protein